MNRIAQGCHWLDQIFIQARPTQAIDDLGRASIAHRPQARRVIVILYHLALTNEREKIIKKKNRPNKLNRLTETKFTSTARRYKQLIYKANITICLTVTIIDWLVHDLFSRCVKFWQKLLVLKIYKAVSKINSLLQIGKQERTGISICRSGTSSKQ